MTEPLPQPAAPRRHRDDRGLDELPRQLGLGGLREGHVMVPVPVPQRGWELMPEPGSELPMDSDLEAGSEPTIRHRWQLGLIAIGFTVALLVLQIVAVSLAASGSYAPATVIGEILAGATVLPVVFGVLAIIRDRGRSIGIVAVVVSILTNPLVLIAVLGLFEGV